MSNPSKQKGTRFETAVADYLRWALGDERIQRLTLHGNKDVGDIGGIYHCGARVTVECKATRAPHYRRHWAECLVEMVNGDANLGIVIWKRPGIGITHRDTVGRHLAYTRRDVLAAIVSTLHDDAATALMAKTEAIPRNGELIGMDLADMARLLNHGLPLGPDQE
ncbi:hypothetical protein [Bifidobacterium pseudolongum]|uniref:Uncharacterized protein n=1 Tax=Bifidobacterium pseudolongum subsp. globosum TaxID=1690 RepID=A0A4Q5A6N7_9BIFI|nr:hypothetical protein [Bifidobacterium pseudolongum]RYQ18972.1 hypothetical protein PG2071B_1093 [Bifidobacterium pseudolongum subsp. globosum]